MLNRLPTQIKAQNLCNTYGNELRPKVIHWLKQFEGGKILRADGAMLKKVRDAKPEFEIPNFRWFLSFTPYLITCEMDFCESFPDHSSCFYAKNHFFAGCLEADRLKTVFESQEELKMNYSVHEITSTRKEIEELEKKISELRQSINPFHKHIH